MIVRQLPPPADLYKSFTPEKANTTLNGLLGFTVGSVTIIGQFFTVLVLSIYWSIDRVHFERLWLSLLPTKSRARSREIWRAIDRDFGAYVRRGSPEHFCGGAAGVWAVGDGDQYPSLLAVFGALVWLIPWLGGVLVVIPIALVGFSQSIGLAKIVHGLRDWCPIFAGFLDRAAFHAAAAVQFTALDPADHCPDWAVWPDGFHRRSPTGSGP